VKFLTVIGMVVVELIIIMDGVIVVTSKLLLLATFVVTNLIQRFVHIPM
jgi:hypothetical protein